MSVEVNLVGTRCGAKEGGLDCTYCYQGSLRRAEGNAAPEKVDLDAIKRTLDGYQGANGFNLFGGEPLLAPWDQIEEMFRFGLERFGQNGIQTSGRLIGEEHFKLFKKYKVHVGFSFDGPGDLNRPRWAGSPEATLEATAATERSMKRCGEEGIRYSCITTLHRFNAAKDRLPTLLDWWPMMKEFGMTSARLHVLEHDGPTKYLALSDEENENALWAHYELERDVLEGGVGFFDIFGDMKRLLEADDENATCIWQACDPQNTQAVSGVGPTGERYLCERVHKEGINWSEAPKGPLVRQLGLAETDFDDGGCRGCRFLLLCKGNCPGTAIDGDWRNRSRDCGLWYSLFSRLETEMREAGKEPITDRDPAELARMHSVMIRAWEMGIQMTLKRAANPWTVPVPGGWHADHADEVKR